MGPWGGFVVENLGRTHGVDRYYGIFVVMLACGFWTFVERKANQIKGQEFIEHYSNK